MGHSYLVEDLGAQDVDPIVSLLPAGIGMLSRRMGLFAGCRVRTQELHATLLRVQIAQHIGHQFVAYMAVGIRDEAIVAKAASFGGP